MTKSKSPAPALCGAKTRTTDKPCANVAGKGTSHVGYGSCKFHGGNTPSNNKHALVLAAKQRMVKLGAPIDDARPADVLLGLLRASAGHVAYLHAEIGAMTDIDSFEAVVTIEMYNEERRIAQSLSESCLRAGIDEAIVRMAEEDAGLIVRAIRAVMNELRLTDGQRKALGPAIQKIAPLLEGGEPDDSMDDAIAKALADDYIPGEWIKPVA